MTRGAKRLLAFMRDRSWHTLEELERECLVEGRSRLSELRAAGYILERRRNHGAHGKASYSHRLIQTVEEVALESESLAELEGNACPSSSSASDTSSSLVEAEPVSVAGSDSASASDEEGRSVVDDVGVEGSAAAATTPASERPGDESHEYASREAAVSAIDETAASFAAVPYHGDCGTAAVLQTPVVAVPAEFGDADGIDESDWRDRFAVGDLEDALPPPSQEQLELPGAVS